VKRATLEEVDAAMPHARRYFIGVPGNLVVEYAVAVMTAMEDGVRAIVAVKPEPRVTRAAGAACVKVLDLYFNSYQAWIAFQGNFYRDLWRETALEALGSFGINAPECCKRFGPSKVSYYAGLDR
jgi:hypothetical protein